MDFSWSKEAQTKRQQLLDFIDHELTANSPELESECGFAAENWQKLADFGVLGFALPKQYGGSELDMLTTVYLLEAMGYGCPDTGLTFALNSQLLSIQPAIHLFGSPEIRERYLPRLVGGAFGAFAISEETSGSDTYSLQATATRTDGGYILNGEKMFITLAPVADIAVVFANVDPSRGQWGVTGFVVEKGQSGFSTTQTRPKMGLRTTPIGDIHLKDCFVPTSHRLGEEGSGVAIFSSAMESERSYILASQVGTMQRQLEQNIVFARKRKQFKQPIGKFQSVAHRIADMKLRLETARLLMYRVAWLETQGEPLVMDAALANLHLSEAFVESSLSAVMNHGARGYLTEYEVERDFRDSVGGLIYSGTSDIQRNIIARLLGL